MKPEVSSSAINPSRTAIESDRIRYDPFAMALHWLTVLLVLVQFGTAQIWGFLPRPERHPWIVAHMSFGILLAGTVAARLAWRLMPGHQVPSAVFGWVKVMSNAVNGLLYAMLVVQAGLGFVLRWSGDQAMSFFGFSIPSPFSPLSKATHALVGSCHNWLGWSIIVLATGHAAAALFHHYVLQDNVLLRMLPGRHARADGGGDP